MADAHGTVKTLVELGGRVQLVLFRVALQMIC